MSRGAIFQAAAPKPGTARGSPPGGPDEVLRARQRRVAEIAGDELVPEAAFACVRLRGGGLGIGEMFVDRGRSITEPGHRRAVGACLGGDRTPCMRNTAPRAPFRLPLRQQTSCDSAL